MGFAVRINGSKSEGLKAVADPRFPRAGRGRQLIILQNISRKLHDNERNWIKRDERLSTPMDPPLRRSLQCQSRFSVCMCVCVCQLFCYNHIPCFRCRYSWTAVHCAANYGNISVLEYMLREQYGIPVNIKARQMFYVQYNPMQQLVYSKN